MNSQTRVLPVNSEWCMQRVTRPVANLSPKHARALTDYNMQDPEKHLFSRLQYKSFKSFGASMEG